MWVCVCGCVCFSLGVSSWSIIEKTSVLIYVVCCACVRVCAWVCGCGCGCGRVCGWVGGWVAVCLCVWVCMCAFH